MESRLSEFRDFPNFRIQIIAAERDLALPSIAEAERLAGLFPNSQVHVVEGAGHASACGSRVDLCAILRSRYAELRSLGMPSNVLDNKSTVNSTESTAQKTNFFLPQLAKRNLRARTTMKEVAASNTGAMFGMEPRYNGKEVGLPVWQYWSKRLFRRARPVENKSKIVF
jgi:hypothetical protein